MINTQTHTSPTAGRRTIREVGWGWREAEPAEGWRRGRILLVNFTSRVPVILSPAPVILSPAPVILSPAPVILLPAVSTFTSRRLPKPFTTAPFFDHKNARKPPP